MKTILLTGATGYIGSHGAVALLEKGYNVIIVDNLSNSSEETIGKKHLLLTLAKKYFLLLFVYLFFIQKIRFWILFSLVLCIKNLQLK